MTDWKTRLSEDWVCVMAGKMIEIIAPSAPVDERLSIIDNVKAALREGLGVYRAQVEGEEVEEQTTPVERT